MRLSKFKPNFRLYGKVALRGLPECISQCATAVTTLWLNQVLAARLGDIAVNAFGVISYLASFSMGIFFGVSEGLQPLFGNSYGAKDEKGLKFYFHAGLIINFVGALVVNGLLLFVGRPICGLFGATGETLDYTVRVLPFYAAGFVFTAVNTMISTYLFSTKRTTLAVVLNTLRSFAVNTFVILVFPMIFGSGIVWYTFVCYEGIVAVASSLLLVLSERRRGHFPPNA
ncbi:MAG: MATE family efflux transporter [Candidatus Gallimonas sp.]